MVRITSDTGSLFNIEEGRKIGVGISPLLVTIGGKTYREFEEISSRQFYDLILEGNLPLSSQPPIGEVVELFNEYSKDGEEVINLSMADGLSGTYQSACSAKKQADHPERIHVINTKTLCGPLVYLVNLANKMSKEGKTVHEIKERMQKSIDNCRSFLMPQDFDYLKRNGRLTPIAAKLSGFLKIQPIVTQTPDGTRLDSFGIGRTFAKAVDKIVNEMKKSKYDHNYITYVSHAFAKEQAQKARDMIVKAFPNMEIQILEISPAFITQGGPKCVAVQSILK